MLLKDVIQKSKHSKVLLILTFLDNNLSPLSQILNKKTNLLLIDLLQSHSPLLNRLNEYFQF
jgi:hypothetical protein